MRGVTDDAVVVFIGKRRTGKSWLLRDLLFYHQDFPVGTVISPTEEVNKFFSDMIPPLFIYSEFDTALVAKILERQRNIIQKIDTKDPQYADIDPRAFIIFDDCLYDNQWSKDKWVRYVFMNGRHMKLMFLITMQYAMGIPPNLRTNIDYTFICREPNFANRDKLYKQYCGMFPTFDVFNQVMEQCTENFECLVVNNVTKSNKIEDQVFWYKASNHEGHSIRIGADILWKMQDTHYTDNPEDDDGDWKSLGKKSRVPIMVTKSDEQRDKLKKKNAENIHSSLRKPVMKAITNGNERIPKQKPSLRRANDFYQDSWNEDI